MLATQLRISCQYGQSMVRAASSEVGSMGVSEGVVFAKRTSGLYMSIPEVVVASMGMLGSLDSMLGALQQPSAQVAC